MTEAKMRPTGNSVEEFLATLDSEKRTDSLSLMDMMKSISSKEPVMWGTSIIGFGSYHYTYESGREGDTCAIGFSPRKANLTVYINEGFERYGDLLERLGKHETSVSCLYIKQLSDVDIDVLKELVGRSYRHLTSRSAKPTTVEEYEAQVPGVAKNHFRTLRKTVRETIPNASETISYDIVAFKIDEKRPVVYISGWKDHVAMYPVPRDEKLQGELKPFIKGKGTLWFRLDKPLPLDLIQKVVIAHIEARQ